MGKYTETVLDNGLRIISKEDKKASLATISFWIKAGSRHESDQQHGYAHLLEHMLSEGTEERPTRKSISLEKDKIGAYSNAFTGNERVYFVIQADDSYFENMIALLSDTIVNSVLDEKILEKEKKVVLNELYISEEKNAKTINILSLKKFFEDHPLSKIPIGNKNSILKATKKELMEYYKKYYIPSRSAFIFNGNIKHDEIVSIVKKYLGGWEKAHQSNPLAEKIEVQKNPGYFFQKNQSKKTFLMFNFYTPGASSVKDSIALDVISNYLGYGHTGFLAQKLRVEKGLVYGVDVRNEIYTDAGRFRIATSTVNPVEVVKIIKESISNILSEFTENILYSIKKQLINSFKRINTNPLKEIEFLGQAFVLFNRLVKPDEYISAVESITYEDIIRVSKKYLNLDNNLLVISGPKDIKNLV